MNNNKLLVSIIMPTYNRADLIGESLDSVLAQTYQNWECLIVDDGSDDNTENVIKGYLEDKRFHYYKKENEGAAIARNYAVSKSKGIYILPLDSDDLIHKTYIEKAEQLLDRNKKLKIVYCEADLFGFENKKWKIPPFDYKLLLIYNMIFNSALFRRIDFEEVGGYEVSSSFEDWDLWIKILKNGGEVYQIQETLFFYRTHKQGSVTNRMKLKDKRYDNNINKLFRDHIDEYLKVIGNPIDLERERRELMNVVKSADYLMAVKIMKSPIFKRFRNFRNSLKRMLSGE